MNKHYLLFASLAYAVPTLRSLQEEIIKRGGTVAWYLEDTCPNMLTNEEKRLYNIKEIIEFNPIAIFAPGNCIYDFLPGVKVQVFHGYPINKRNRESDTHFKMRGWFDMYCTQGDSSTPTFKKLEKKHKYFKVYETGWCKTDIIVKAKNSKKQAINDKPTIFVASTFTSGISSLRTMLPTIKKLIEKKDWNWTITMHPKLKDDELRQDIINLTKKYQSVKYLPAINNVEELNATDVMLCDSSSIIIEYMLLEKPVVTYCNTRPGEHLINVTNTEDIEGAIEKALKRPKELLENIRKYTSHHEKYTDGNNCARILEAVDDFILKYKGRLPSKPLNLVRKFKIRKKLNYWKF